MKLRRHRFIVLIAVLFVSAYGLGYLSYRIWGPTYYDIPKGLNTTSGVLVSVETPIQNALYWVFYPCFATEDFIRQPAADNSKPGYSTLENLSEWSDNTQR
jgi:hypothetical protein